MTETLPISIQVAQDLLDKFVKLKAIANKLEALFNFQTLTANWYGDEEDILTIRLSLETPASFKQCQGELETLSADSLAISEFSDDVISGFNQSEQQLRCHIAITESELSLLTQQPKILKGFVQAKLHKVLNLIATQQSLASI
ncbi:hypothetical protein [Colwellia piezophila]|uniref:hypothetical protein n=1 Tax=Colwellia piezophila TaxID=211668 RepID=UPI00037B3FD4|nr:hypothetical protein [Colwellia piezophila]